MVEAVDLARAPLADVLAALGTDTRRGLAGAEARTRLQRVGPNEIPPRARHPVRAFLRKFWGLSAWMLELIMVLSWVLHKYADLVLVGVLLVLNAIIARMQEQRASGVVAALRGRLQVSARVVREGAWQSVAARGLVPGDVIRLRAGDFAPADVRLLSGELRVDQSALTGESRDVTRGVGDLLYSGSLARRGEAGGVVIETGVRTYFGRTVELVQAAQPKLHVEAMVAGVVARLFAVVGVLVAAAIVLAAVRGFPLLEVLPLALVLLMSAVPVALPVMFTVSTAVGSAELARKGVLVTRLSAVEDAATADVLCVDKTGTITTNRLSVTEVVPLAGAAGDEVVAAGVLASQEANQDPIDLAFFAAARAPAVGARLAGIRPLSFTPFDPSMRRTEALVEQDGRRIRVVKGAVGVVARMCGRDDAGVAALEEQARALAARGDRVLAVARGPEGQPPALLGLVALADAPRPDAAALIAALREHGVAVKMLTGDALPVAQEIARKVGLTTVRRAGDLKSAAAPALTALAESADGLAEVYPEDKYVVVTRLQQAGHVVGMTGDGVNDAPALRQAEIGIAVSTATDVAKGAASVVLTDEGLSGIVTLIEQGRVTYQRILTWVINKISRTILKAGFVTLAFLITGRFVISAFAMLLLVFLTDFAKIALATDNVRWSRRPESWRSGGHTTIAVLLGAVMIVEAYGMLLIGARVFAVMADDGRLATFTFLVLFYFALFSIVSIRERRRFWASRPGGLLVVALALDALVGTGLALAGAPGLTPLPWTVALTVLGYAMVCGLVVNDALKLTAMRRLGLET